jgi:molybdopterin synthase catalytic subunit
MVILPQPTEPRASVVSPPVSFQAAPDVGDDWFALTPDVLPVAVIHDWSVLPRTGAVVLFSGTVRDHAEHRTNVTLLDYEAYESQVVPRLQAIGAEIRASFGEIGRVALLHRIGPLALCEVSVVVSVSAAHRDQAFEAARFGIDTLKATVPIWKREHWAEGSDWGLASRELTDLAGIAGVGQGQIGGLSVSVEETL